MRSRVRLGRRAELQEAIREAFDQLAADERYENEKGYRLAETRDRIKSIKHQIDNLIVTMEGLSPVGMAAMHDVGLRHGQDTGRVGLAAWRARLAKLAAVADASVDFLVERHSPIHEEGQGTGSAMGRDSDLRAIRVDHGVRNSKLPPFRSPKDKFAVRVVKAIIRAGFDPAARGAGVDLERRLNRIWSGFLADQPSPNWDRVIKARHAIADWVQQELRSEKPWKKVVRKRNASLRRKRRCTLKESPSYVVAPDQTGDCDVDLEGKRGSNPAGPERKHSQ